MRLKIHLVTTNEEACIYAVQHDVYLTMLNLQMPLSLCIRLFILVSTEQEVTAKKGSTYADSLDRTGYINL